MAQLSMKFIRAARQANIGGESIHTLCHTHLGKSHLEAAAFRLDGVLSLPARDDEQKHI